MRDTQESRKRRREKQNTPQLAQKGFRGWRANNDRLAFFGRRTLQSVPIWAYQTRADTDGLLFAAPSLLLLLAVCNALLWVRVGVRSGRGSRGRKLPDCNTGWTPECLTAILSSPLSPPNLPKVPHTHPLSFSSFTPPPLSHSLLHYRHPQTDRKKKKRQTSRVPTVLWELQPY